MKRCYAFIMIVIALLLCGCENLSTGRKEIDKIFVVRAMAIDIKEDGAVSVVLATKSTSKGGKGGSGGEEEKSETISAQGKTVYEAAQKLLSYSDKEPHYGHTEYIFIGEETAKQGILPYLDFMSRLPEGRYNAKIYIVKGTTAESLLQSASKNKMFIADKMNNLEDDDKELSLASSITLNEALLIFDNPNISTFLPYVQLRDQSAARKKDEVELKGYAIFNEDKLMVFADEDISFGINLIMNRVKSGVLVVEHGDGGSVGLKITNSKVKLVPQITDGTYSCKIKLSFATNISEVMTKDNIFREETLKSLVSKQNDILKKDMEKAISLAQNKNLDMFGMITKFGFKYPMMRDTLSMQWKNIFSGIKTDVETESKISRSYLIKEAVGSNLESEQE